MEQSFTLMFIQVWTLFLILNSIVIWLFIKSKKNWQKTPNNNKEEAEQKKKKK